MSRILTTLVILFVAAVPRIHASCTNATLLGTWGFTGTGMVVLPSGPNSVAAVGAVHFALSGNVSGSQDRSLGGASQHETFSGTYSVTSDCALTITANVYDDAGNLQRITVLKGVVVNNGKETRMIYQSIILPNGVPLPSVLTLDGNKV